MPSDWLPRTDLGLRALVIVAIGAVVGLRVLHDPAATGVGILSGLLVVLADFHGERSRRLRAYLITAVAGAALIGALSALHATPLAVLALIAALMAMALTILKNGGGAFPAAANALLADTLLGLAAGMSGIPATSALIAALIGGLGATACAMLIRPAPWISPVRGATLNALAACSQSLRSGRAQPSGELASSLMRVYIERPERPATPTPGATASLDLLSDLTFLADLLAVSDPPRDAQSLARLLDAAAEALRHPHHAAARVELESQARAMEQQPEAHDFPTRCMRWAALGVAHSTQVIAGPTTHRGAETLRIAIAQSRVRLSPTSTVLWSGLAAGVVFAALVTLVGLLGLPHPQWVFLCAISTFYPYTRRAAARAAAIVSGTLAGFLTTLLLILLLGQGSHGWWLVLLLATWVSMSAPHTTTGTVYGQAAFTVLSLSMVGLAAGEVQVTPGVERVSDIALGVAVALATIAVLAPKNLRRRLCRALSHLNTDVAAALSGEQIGAPAVRADFLRCTDIVDAIRGVGAIDTGHLVAWLNCARLGAQAYSVVAVTGAPQKTIAPMFDEQAAAFRAVQAVPFPPAVTTADPASIWLQQVARMQAEQSASLCPLEPAARLRASPGSVYGV